MYRTTLSYVGEQHTALITGTRRGHEPTGAPDGGTLDDGYVSVAISKPATPWHKAKEDSFTFHRAEELDAFIDALAAAHNEAFPDGDQYGLDEDGHVSAWVEDQPSVVININNFEVS